MSNLPTCHLFSAFQRLTLPDELNIGRTDPPGLLKTTARKGSVLATAVRAQGKGSVLVSNAVEAQGKGSVSVSNAVEAQGKCSVLVSNAVKAQGKGSVLPAVRSAAEPPSLRHLLGHGAPFEGTGRH